MKVFNRTVNDDILAVLVKKIKEKKELVNLDDSYCLERISCYLQQNKKVLKKLSEADDFSKIKKSSEISSLIKAVRREIGVIYGGFQSKKLAKVDKLLDELKETLSVDLHKRILLLHKSTNERIKNYPKFFKKIFEITGKPKSILDLGCGFNPIAFPYMDLEKVRYLATELNKKDVLLIQKYFDIIGFGKAAKYDLTKDFPKEKFDVCFVLKVFDLLESKITEKIVKGLKVKYIIASFPTKTLTKQQMRFKRRAGFQKMLRRLNLKFKTINFDNELVYIIEK